jgi:predicted small secreted protein
MKQTLSIAFALALAGALLTGCDRPAEKAGAGGTSASGSTSGSASGSAGAGGTAGQSTEKKAPSSPTPPPSK